MSRKNSTFQPVPVAERLLDPRELGDHFGVKSQTVLEWFHAGKIPARVALGRTYRFELHEVTQALAQEAAETQAGATKCGGVIII